MPHSEQRKGRQQYMAGQKAWLEHEFSNSRYVSRKRRQELVTRTGLSDRQVKIWFQNRRMKEKKEKGRGGNGLAGLGSTESEQGDDDRESADLQVPGHHNQVELQPHEHGLFLQHPQQHLYRPPPAVQAMPAYGNINHMQHIQQQLMHQMQQSTSGAYPVQAAQQPALCTTATAPKHEHKPDSQQMLYNYSYAWPPQQYNNHVHAKFEPK